MAEKSCSLGGGDIEDHDFVGTSSDTNSIMNVSQILSYSTDAQTKTNVNKTHNIGGGYCRFPKLEECAHFHYERVELGQISVLLVEDKTDLQSSNASQHETSSQTATSWFIIKVTAEKSDPYLIRRSFENLKMLDEMLHRCVYDRKISGLRELDEVEITPDLQIENIVSTYLTRFSNIASDSLTCGPVLTWFQLDNKGRRLPLADMDTMKSINTPAVGAAYGIRKYTAQACDEISIDVGDMISVIDMPSPAESTWWRGKKSHLQKSHYEVGFFPQTCVATIGDKVPRHLVLPAPLVGSLAVSPTKPVLRKHGKLIAFFRSFILSRPSRRRLKQSGIYKERVFSCDLSEHLLNSGQDIPMVLKCCSEFIEEHGIVDGIYRLSGITSNIQKLRRSFDEERVPDLTHPEIRQDIHAMSSLLKMYFRELPNPLCTYQLYDNFVDAIQTKGDASLRLKVMKETVQKLPPPHYRTLKYLAQHLNTIARQSVSTGMTDRNLAIVWAPNLLRSPSLESGGVAALRGVGVQAVVTEYLITNCGLIFDPNDDYERYESLQYESSLTDTESIQVEQRDHLDHSCIERPKSLSVGGPKLISLEEAQTRHNRLEFIDINKSNINMTGGSSSYIEVGGGPSSLPDKYHTVLPVPRSWQKRKTHSWKSLFTRNTRNANQDVNPTTAKKTIEISSPCQVEVNVKHISLRSETEKMAKSIDIYESKPMEICVRSNSIDSLRTVGHSRSVSHDSYFDLLQSPLRGGVTSRELSELGINFDREEPEMRIFSESESLVSSPKVAKETSRRTLRSRPDDYSNVNNSVNPSPKKQPRLNLQSPTDGARWSAISNTQSISTDESMCKRYKLEDQLSDIQFIDCTTPEHTTLNANTIYTSVQIHNASSASTPTPPTSPFVHIQNAPLSSARNADKEVSVGFNRNSYPDTKHNDQSTLERKEERFSYPGMGRKFTDDKKYVCRLPVNEDMNAIAHHKKMSKAGRFSYCDPNSIAANKEPPVSAINLILRSCSAELTKQNDTQRSKLSIATPSSPSQSPRYSLLVGETSSENSSSLNTPVFENKEFSTLLSETSSSQIITNTNRSNPVDDMQNMESLKQELSLDLEGSKMSVDDTSLSSLNKQIINIPSTPNTPNYTHTSGNTSQSMTPSEFGYQHLNRQSGAVSLESSPKSCDTNLYENLERSFSSYDGTTRLNIAQKIAPAKSSSPIRSTINITYNLRSPVRNATHENIFFSGNADSNKSKTVSGDYEVVNVVSDLKSKTTKPLLETSFDENTVYEQVKFFKGAVSEVNLLLLDNGNDNECVNADSKQPELETDLLLFSMDDEVNDSAPQVVPNVALGATKSEEDSSSTYACADVKRKFVENDDVLMSDDHDVDIQDSLEMNSEFSLYENVEYRKPTSIYENVIMKPITKPQESKDDNESSQVTIKQPVNFIVRQLANKFETSPVDSAPFDLIKPSAKKLDTNQNSPSLFKSKMDNKQLHKTVKITRSLDENAFEREFGSICKLDGVTKGSQQIPQIDCVSRRMSLEYIRPKTLNPPKRLPDLDDNETEICKSEGKSTLKPSSAKKVSDDVAVQSAPIKITPTTENPISLIQHNVNVDMPSIEGAGGPTVSNDDEKNPTMLTNIKVLGSFKLDRERIEKIKEERRHQLSEKFRSESFRGSDHSEYKKEKSKSKIELRELKDIEPKSESLRSKESSIGDYTSSHATLGLISNRVRRISDEKNQNECVDYMLDDAKMTDVREKAVTNRVRRFDENDFGRDRDNYSTNGQQMISAGRSSLGSQRERISPQFSIRDVRTMFESRSQNQ
ncbi:GTPase-activating protein CdGAPr [Bradysia coprophila]|uniref:GTPase-activating protein CdGAPr n=1 Tax=Bradysia coprophila TaxID=38358 RepID=UPI00187DC171|nr:GTPase-activating protein CdGAPr [Bradysia coprophila]XP_037032219.1 GTPase-activating protein CdGAPr [Bradysia coprophila]